MESSRSKQIRAGAVLSYVQMFFSVVISLVYTPVMLRLLGQSEYGLYNTAASTVSMLSMLNLGFSSGYIRYYAQYKKRGDVDAIYKLNGLFLIIFSIIGIIAFACGFYLTYHLEAVFQQGLTESEYVTAKTLLMLLTIDLAISFPMSVFSSIINAHERFVFVKSIGILNTVIGPLVTLPLLLMGYKSIGMVLVTVVVSLISYGINAVYVFSKLKQKIRFGKTEQHLMYGLFQYTIFIAINIFVNQINLNVDKLLLARFRGTTAVAIYSVGYMLQHYYQLFSVSISDLFTPKIHLIYNDLALSVQEKKKQIDTLFIQVGRIQFALLALIMTGLVFFGETFILYWAGAGYEEAYYVALLLIIPLTIPLIQNTGIEIQRAQNKHKFRAVAYSIMAIVNLIVSIPLCISYGPVGSAIGTAFSFVIANGFIMNLYYYKKMDINIPGFWKSILSMCKGIILPVVAGVLMRIFIKIDSPIILILLIVLYSLIFFVSFWLLSLTGDEKDLFKGIGRRILTRR